jgi:hypothetical protein
MYVRGPLDDVWCCVILGALPGFAGPYSPSRRSILLKGFLIQGIVFVSSMFMQKRNLTSDPFQPMRLRVAT